MSRTASHSSAWRPTATLEVARRRAQMLAAARAFFAEHDILEVDTPALSPAAASDPHLESIPVALSADPDRSYYLQTSPEFAMKRLLCDGWPDIGQVGKAWRDGEVGRHHQPEFTLIEWYRRGLGLHEMMAHTVAFIERLLDGGTLAAGPEFLSFADAFRQHAELDPLTAPVDRLAAAAGADDALRGTLGEHRGDWLDLLLGTHVVPRFAGDRLTVLYHYPAAQAALARLCPADTRVADRFEVFFGALELANGYVELGDAAAQRRRFERDQQERLLRRKSLRPVDRLLLAALEHGLPDCAGVAVGFDRLVMIDTGVDELGRVQTFTVADPD